MGYFGKENIPLITMKLQIYYLVVVQVCVTRFASYTYLSFSIYMCIL